jgi:two-component sensor histidine kinase
MHVAVQAIATQTRIAVEGPANVWLDSTKSVVVAMVVHELAINALKYGALSNGSGRVSVTWKQHSQPNRVKLVWQESGGPEISPPQRKGFGSHLIERASAVSSARRNSCSARKAFLAHSKSSASHTSGLFDWVR